DRAALGRRGVKLEDVVRANATRLAYLEREAIAYLDSYKPFLGLIVPTLGFSGGKDSVVLAHIVSRTKFRTVHVYQINTGIEPGYNEEFSNEFLARYKRFWVHQLFSKDLFWRTIQKLGPQALDFQWCRTILKNLSFYRQL